MVEKSGVPFVAYHEVQAGPMHGVNLKTALSSLVKLARGFFASWGILSKHQPDVVVNTGGWAAIPVTIAAWIRRIPIVVYLPDIEPGLTIVALRRLATRVAATTQESDQFIPPDKLVVTGYPLRRNVMAATREAALAHFKLDPNKKTLLVFGGSRGARSINIAVIDALPKLLERGDMQIIHVTGELDADRAEAVKSTPNYHPFAYLHEDMGLAMAAADLCVCRSGASTLGELPYFGLPSILVPYPHAWRYQKVNADYLASRGAALVLHDEEMSDKLADHIHALLNSPTDLARMKQAAHDISQGDAAANIVALLREVCRAHPSAGGTPT